MLYMKTPDIKKKSDADLITLLGELRETARQIRFGVSGNVKNTRALSETKKSIARIMTEVTLRKKDQS